MTAITADDGPFKTVYAVDDDGQATAALDRSTVFDAVGLDGTIYLADGTSELLALPPWGGQTPLPCPDAKIQLRRGNRRA